MRSLTVDVILPAAGVGSRMGLGFPKQYLQIDGKTVLEHTVDAIFSSEYVHNIIIGVSREDSYIQRIHFQHPSRIVLTEGGQERSDTVRLALASVTTDFVMVHDAARPFVRKSDLNNLVESLSNDDVGGILACKISDTIKKVSNSEIISTVPRHDLYRAFTPQMFRTALLLKVLNFVYENGIAVTDDASAFEALGLKVKIIEGHSDNIKLTTSEDVEIAKMLMSLRKTKNV